MKNQKLSLANENIEVHISLDDDESDNVDYPKILKKLEGYDKLAVTDYNDRDAYIEAVESMVQATNNGYTDFIIGIDYNLDVYVLYGKR